MLLAVVRRWIAGSSAPLAALSTLCIAIASSASAADAPITRLFQAPAENSQIVVDHGAWTKLLQTYVKPGADGLNRVDYAAFKASGHTELKTYLSALEATDPRQLNRPEQFAFLANLYNAKTIDIVLDHYPVKSIKDIALGGSFAATFTGGPWKAKVLKIQGVEASLDDVEHGALRPIFRDPRVHYAVNCASVGCPNLGIAAFTGANLEKELDAAARAYVNHSRGVTFDADGRPVVSSIYKWFQADFGGSDAGVLKHLRKYAAPELVAKLKATEDIAGNAYDWSLNDNAKASR